MNRASGYELYPLYLDLKYALFKSKTPLPLMPCSYYSNDAEGVVKVAFFEVFSEGAIYFYAEEIELMFPS